MNRRSGSRQRKRKMEWWRDMLKEAGQALLEAGVEEPGREAGLLWRLAWGRSLAEWIPNPGPYVPQTADRYRNFVLRRCRREPFHYIAGEREFMGLPMHVTPAVLIPRPETEVLVQAALERLTTAGDGPIIADVGTGSGAVALALKRWAPDKTEVIGTDCDPAALQVARENGRRLRLAVDWRLGDLLAPVSETVSLVVANLPYVDPADRDRLAPELAYEPPSALFADDRGLHLMKRLLEEARARLGFGGWVLLECGQGQWRTMACAAEALGYRVDPPILDYAGHRRVVAAFWPQVPK